MFRIRRIYDDIVPANKEAIRKTQEMLREHFSQAPEQEVEQLPERLRNPLKKQLRTILYVAENTRGSIQGFAIVLHEPELKFCFLDFLASAKELSGRGIGGALYERVRNEVLALGCHALFCECSPDDPDQCRDPQVLKQNVQRLKFYERYGARPVLGTNYQAPVKPDDVCLPFLLYDDLDLRRPLRKEFAQKSVRAILERKYGYLCPPEYVDLVVKSITDDPVPVREPRYVRQEPRRPIAVPAGREPIMLVVNDKHDIHHVRERGYVESPVRINVILSELEQAGLFERMDVKHYSEKAILAVHDADFVTYLRRICASLPPKKSVYPYVFPIRNATRPPKELSVQAGYYCIDTFTPLNQNAYLAAKRSVDCALTAADQVLSGKRLAYALIRPPGHHAERRAFGGFCYFNNNAVAANYLSKFGRVAVLDIDYHHGNGQQDIFYHRNDVLTVSIHGHPNFAYPYFSGFADEVGQDAGEGFNLNLPLPEAQTGEQHRKALGKALKRVADFAPDFLVLALGLDPAKGDPTGTWSLGARDFEANGRMIGELRLPTLVVQEGGYRTRTLGVNARHFFTGLAAGADRP